MTATTGWELQQMVWIAHRLNRPVIDVIDDTLAIRPYRPLFVANLLTAMTPGGVHWVLGVSGRNPQQSNRGI